MIVAHVTIVMVGGRVIRTVTHGESLEDMQRAAIELAQETREIRLIRVELPSKRAAERN